jgi:hypothetical protein
LTLSTVVLEIYAFNTKTVNDTKVDCRQLTRRLLVPNEGKAAIHYGASLVATPKVPC